MVTTRAPEGAKNEDESPLVVTKRATQTQAEPTTSATSFLLVFFGWSLIVVGESNKHLGLRFLGLSSGSSLVSGVFLF